MYSSSGRNLSGMPKLVAVNLSQPAVTVKRSKTVNCVFTAKPLVTAGAGARRGRELSGAGTQSSRHRGTLLK